LYGRFTALRDLTFSVGEGITGLIGPNGAGKSTFIKVILGIIKPTHGIIKIFGLDSRRQRSKIMEKVGVLHEKPSLPPWVTARRYLEYVARIKRLDEVGKEVGRVSEICSLGAYIDRRIGTFSAGMAQRLGLADALIGRPDLVILDEPTANLDPLGRYDVLTKVRRLRDEEKTNFLISTHILPELEKVCDNVVILNQGTLLTYGSYSELMEKSMEKKYVVRVDHPEVLVNALGKGSVARVEVKDDVVTADVSDESAFLNEINDLVRSNVITVTELRPLSPSLEDVFVKALRRKQD
jgi:ABC-2 type transport system ATP-binding protein